MPFLLDTKNVFNYLIQHQLCRSDEQDLSQIYPKIGKNFNLLICLPNDRHLLIKQESLNALGQANGDLQHEWLVYQFIQQYPELSQIRSLVSDAIHFDAEQAIAVFNYLHHYQDLDDFYDNNEQIPTAVAAQVGATLARIHRATIDRADYKAFLDKLSDDETIEQVPDFGHGLAEITPEIFGTVSADAIKFYELYQRYEQLGEAIAALNKAFRPCCLTHNDLKFNNILLHIDWETASPNSLKDAMIRFIDWEKWAWGDPAFDLGSLIADYLKLWLKSLVVSPEIEIQMALSLATKPLEALQPSIISLTRSYLQQFPEILDDRDFLLRVMQFTGYALIESIQARIHYHEPFGNVGICLLQVAKTLLCTPEQSMITVFGITTSELMQFDRPFSTKQQGFQAAKRPSLVRSPQIQTNITLEPETVSKSEIQPMQVEEVLEDLVHHLEIGTEFEISHRRYKPLELPPHVLARYLQLPASYRHKYLSQQLRDYLYDIYFSGEQPLAKAPEPDEISHLKNDQVRGLNLAFYEQLHRSNHGTGYFDPGWRVVRVSKQRLVVQKDGLSLRIEPINEAIAKPCSPSVDQPIRIGTEVAIHLPKNQIETGFYLAIGNAGLVSDQQPAVEICFNINPAGAIALMEAVTQLLNALAIPFSFKVLSDPADYGRYDAGVLQIERVHYAIVQPILQQIYQQGRSYFSPMVPLFTKPLAPGLSLAEVPETDSKDFGIHRCQILAIALLAARKAGDSPKDCVMRIKQAFSARGIDLQRPYLNPNAEDIYIPLHNG
jgi:hypothetical protein